MLTLAALVDSYLTGSVAPDASLLEGLVIPTRDYAALAAMAAAAAPRGLLAGILTALSLMLPDIIAHYA
jgi:hypothetical protein